MSVPNCKARCPLCGAARLPVLVPHSTGAPRPSAQQAHLAARGGVRVETRLDHLDRADLHSMSIMHTKGDMAGAAPDKEFNFPLWEYGSELPDAAWRQVSRAGAGAEGGWVVRRGCAGLQLWGGGRVGWAAELLVAWVHLNGLSGLA